MNKLFILISVLWTFALFSNERPNIIIIMTDDQGYGDLSCKGNPILKTPAIDKLFSEGLQLEGFHTDPMCAPTRAGLMTGRYSARTGVWSTLYGRYYMRADETTIADIFSNAGYRTGIFGKWHLGDSYPYRAHDRGFQEAITFGGGVIGEAPDAWNNDYFTTTYSHNGKPLKVNQYCTDFLFDSAKEFIRASGDKPFLCYIPTNAPHGPMDVHEKYSKPYLDYFKQHGIGKLKGTQLEKTIKKRANFYGMIANIDENVGKLRQFLKEKNLSENTILLYFGDNGTAGGVSNNKKSLLINGYNAGMRGAKCLAYEGGHRNACSIYWPAGKLTGGKEIHALTAQLDLMPTLMDMAGVQNSSDIQFDGRSILPNLQGKTQPSRSLIVHNMQLDTPQKFKEFAVMDGDWRLVRTSWRGADSGEMLFNLKNDPGQNIDVAKQFPEVQKRLHESYNQWWSSLSDVFRDYSPIFIGSQFENPVLITSHAWHGEGKVYNQKHIREANPGNGFWTIKAASEGDYEIELRRWPREVNLPIRAALPARTNVPYVTDLPAGKALDIKSIRFVVQSIDGTQEIFSHSQKVRATDCHITFKIKLKKGDYRFQSFCELANGDIIGAYYMYVRKR
ncbi:arylsulfatase [Lentisphaera profundi]|uniref:Arylsulfatase n=1 Tax=Lentisphaera profundi TaxID=1658616 RepID=A0ABY7VUJ8_9BACT|nr:arylsulfatase [Lentisphaera profundi]WDE96506.1 arylsulfatase [Lentisphaera profundi]